jgi:large subunit ribosomal protein L23
MYKQVIIKPIITEKSSLISIHNKYVFQVSTNVNKIEIRNAVERLFNVKVTGVNTVVVKGKKKRLGRFEGVTADWKKAVVTLKDGYKIDNFEKLA